MALLLLVQYSTKKSNYSQSCNTTGDEKAAQAILPSHQCFRDFKRTSRNQIQELRSTFAAVVKFAVSIKGIENALDKRIPRNSEYGTLNKNFFIQVF